MVEQQNKELEKFIQLTLNDDMPSDLEERFINHVHEFFDTRQEETSLSIPDFKWMKPFLDWISKPAVSFAVTAALFAFIIMVSAFTYISNERSALATTIDTIQLTSKVFSAIETAHAMTVNDLRMEKDGSISTNTINWENGISRIDFKNGETWMISNGITEIHHPGQEHTVIKPLHETAVMFASPERIKNQLMGKWKVFKQPVLGSTKPVKITINNLREGYSVQLWIDPSTYLPVRIETQAVELPGGGTINWEKIHMDLVWNQPVDIDVLPFTN